MLHIFWYIQVTAIKKLIDKLVKCLEKSLCVAAMYENVAEVNNGCTIFIS